MILQGDQTASAIEWKFTWNLQLEESEKVNEQRIKEQESQTV